ncbi:MAG: protein-L-isoaspartate O-methyltransferase [Lautropia sp.]|nr:protein-L-isoaspartate O-methyltransferase [Lautropia sp.]
MNIEQARYNMIEQQIRPWNVRDPKVLQLLADVKREEFVPLLWRGIAFADTEVPLTIDEYASGQVMLAPKVEAHILQSTAIRTHESVLEIGTGSGYGTALAAHCSRRVSSWEIDPRLAEFAATNLGRAGLVGLDLRVGDGHQALKSAEGHWDVIILSGAVAIEPIEFLERLATGGRLFCFVGEAPVMEARLYCRTEAGIEYKDVFETIVPALKGFPVASHFHF